MLSRAVITGMRQHNFLEPKFRRREKNRALPWKPQGDAIVFMTGYKPPGVDIIKTPQGPKQQKSPAGTAPSWRTEGRSCAHRSGSLSRHRGRHCGTVPSWRPSLPDSSPGGFLSAARSGRQHSGRAVGSADPGTAALAPCKLCLRNEKTEGE